MTSIGKWLIAATLALSGIHAAPGLAAEDVQFTAVDWKSLQRAGDRAGIWLLRSFPETTLLGHELYPHRSQRIQYVIDCTDRTYALSQWVLTDGENGSGQVVWADRNASLSFVKPAQGTVEAGVVHAACSLEPATRVAKHPLRFLPGSSPLSN